MNPNDAMVYVLKYILLCLLGLCSNKPIILGGGGGGANLRKGGLI